MKQSDKNEAKRQRALLGLQDAISAFSEAEDADAAMQAVRKRLPELERLIRELNDVVVTAQYELLYRLAYLKGRDS
jgi:hypothetical protein